MSSENIYPKKSNKKLTTEEFIAESIAIHNNKYDYSKIIFKTKSSKVIIICPQHGEFQQLPKSHLNGHGCRKCYDDMVGIRFSSSAIEFIQKAIKIHGHKYDYSKVEYTKSSNKVTIICPTHGDFLQTPNKHLSNQNCPQCSLELRGNLNRESNESFISICNSLHKHKYDYSLAVYTNAHEKIKILCPIHGEFCQMAYTHKQGGGCPKCSSNISKISNEWLDSLNLPSLIKEYRLPENNKRPVDGYDPTTNTVYQFHGSYWHSDLRLYDPNSMHKTKKILHCDNNLISQKRDNQIIQYGYNLVIMWEYDWLNK